MKKKILFFSGAWSNAKDAFAPQVSFLQNDYDIIFPDINQFDNIQDMAEFTVNKYNNIYLLIGLSMGGFIVQDILTRYPKFASQAILMGTFAHKQTKDSKKFFQSLIQKIHEGKFHDLCSLYSKDMVSPEFFSNNHSIVNKISQFPISLGEKICINHSKACIDWQGCIDLLKNIEANTLILAAEFDNAAPLVGHKQLHQEISNSSFKIIKNSGHFMNLEQPDILNNIINEWITVK